jgi:hypothetical protein
MSYILRLRIAIKKSALEYIRQIIRQIPAKESVVRQPKKVYGEMIGMGAKSSTIVIAVTVDFFCDCWAAEVRVTNGKVLLLLPQYYYR